ncbi:MAG: response regulator [Bdellovibrionaceae bacterium]|nr:response regulator [Pseudobdellovibrionaceae bacterium]
MKKSDIHILIVDDDPSVLKVLKELIERSGFKVSAVATPQEANSVVRLKTFNLAIIDCMLPIINGIDLAKQLLSSNLKGVPILLISGVFRDEQFADEALKKSGAIEFLTKPFDTAALLAKINSLLSPLLDYKGGSLESLLTKLELTNRESKKSLDYLENIVGLDLILIFNVLMQSKLSGYLNITDSNKKLFGFTMFEGKIIDVDTLKNVKEIAALISKMGLVSVSDASNMLSTIDKRNPIGFLVSENLISPHMARFIKIDKILEDYKRLVGSKKVNVSFIENKDIEKSDIYINKENFDFLNYELCNDIVHADFLETFFDNWMNHSLAVTSDFQKSTSLKNLNAEDEELLGKFKDGASLSTLINDNSKEKILRLAFFLIVNRLAHFSEEMKDKSSLDPSKRYQSILDKITDKNPFEVFQYFGSKKNPSVTEVEKIYKEFARANHPDKLPKNASKELVDLNNRVYSILSEAYSILSNTEKRLQLMNTLKEKEAKAQIKGEDLKDKALVSLERSQYHEALDMLIEAGTLYSSLNLRLCTIWAMAKVDPEKFKTKIHEYKSELEEFDAENRQNSLYHFVFGLICNMERKHEDAEKFFNRSLEFDKSFLSARRELALLRSKDKSKKKGTDFLTGDVTSIISGIFNKKKSG